MSNGENNLVLITIMPDSRSTSPMTPSPLREMKGIRLFRAIGRKLARRSNEDIHYQEETDGRSSSSDSCSSTSTNCSSTSTNRSSRHRKDAMSGDSGFRSSSPNQMSSSSSESGSDSHKSRHHHSTSAESIRKVFQNLSLNVRSRSCTNKKEKRKSKKPAPKRILRQPVTYTYVKGLSGLPTQRIPMNNKNFNSCGCALQSGLNR